LNSPLKDKYFSFFHRCKPSALCINPSIRLVGNRLQFCQHRGYPRIYFVCVLHWHEILARLNGVCGPRFLDTERQATFVGEKPVFIGQGFLIQNGPAANPTDIWYRPSCHEPDITSLTTALSIQGNLVPLFDIQLYGSVHIW
jgi:hypothetical protein